MLQEQVHLTERVASMAARRAAQEARQGVTRALREVGPQTAQKEKVKGKPRRVESDGFAKWMTTTYYGHTEDGEEIIPNGMRPMSPRKS